MEDQQLDIIDVLKMYSVLLDVDKKMMLIQLEAMKQMIEKLKAHDEDTSSYEEYVTIMESTILKKEEEKDGN